MPDIKTIKNKTMNAKTTYAIFQGKAYKTEQVHISSIRPGDTILHTDGQVKTVCRNNITRNPFMGLSLFGDTYRLGSVLVTRFITGNGGLLVAAN